MDGCTCRTDLAYPEIASIFAEIFQHLGPLSPTTSPDHVEKWDSLHHIALIRELEAVFSLSLSMDEMMEIRSVGDIENVLRRHGV
jgi:acyl carrier protein